MGDELTTKEKECLADIKLYTDSKTMAGMYRGLTRFLTLIDSLELDSSTSDHTVEPSDPTESWTLEQHQMRARAYRIVGVPPCIAINHGLQCRCCFDA